MLISAFQVLSEWNRYENRAGFVRNGEIVEYADAIVAFRG